MPNRPLTEEERNIIDKINATTKSDMNNIWRWAISGHPYWDCSLPHYGLIKKKVKGSQYRPN